VTVELVVMIVVVVVVVEGVAVIVLVVVVSVVSVTHPLCSHLLVSFNKYLLFDIFKVVTLHIVVL
jgi:hypothetical protein